MAWCLEGTKPLPKLMIIDRNASLGHKVLSTVKKISAVFTQKAIVSVIAMHSLSAGRPQRR